MLKNDTIIIKRAIAQIPTGDADSGMMKLVDHLKNGRDVLLDGDICNVAGVGWPMVIALPAEDIAKIKSFTIPANLDNKWQKYVEGFDCNLAGYGVTLARVKTNADTILSMCREILEERKD